MIPYDPKKPLAIIFATHGTVGPRVVGYVAIMALWSAAIVTLHQVFPIRFDFGTAAHTIVGVALGLLLVFRTNTAYDRYWEGRQQLEELGIATRNLATRANAVVPPDETDYRHRLATLINAYVVTVKEQLRAGIGVPALNLPDEASRTQVQGFTDLPTGLLAQLSEHSRGLVKQGWIAPPEYGAFAGDINQLQDVYRSLVRIRSTPIPFAYVNQLKVFMLLYLATLPFALAPAFDWGTVVAVVFIVYALVGIEEIGVEIEDPFGDDPNDLPSDALCTTIQRDIHELLQPPAAR